MHSFDPSLKENFAAKEFQLNKAIFILPTIIFTIATQTTATLSWPSAATATSYDVYIWTGATPPASPTANVATTSYSATGLTASTLYNWYIAPRNAGGAATTCAASNTTTFTTAAAVVLPACVVNTSPVNGATLP